MTSYSRRSTFPDIHDPEPPTYDEPEAYDGGTSSYTSLSPELLVRAIEDGRNELPRHLYGAQFPSVSGGDAGNLSRGAHTPQHPQASIASMAKRGWEIDDDAGPAALALTSAAKRVKLPSQLPAVELPDGDRERAEQWTAGALQGILKEQSKYFEHGLHGSKRDVAPGLDPIQQGLLSESRAHQLLDA